MKSSPVRTATTVVLAAVAVAALAIAALRPTAEVVVVEQDPVNFETATVDDAVVTSRTSDDGLSFLGITFRHPTYRVAVGFTAPPECAAVLAAASSWPTGDPACGPAGRFAGAISATGITAGGDAIVGVAFDVSLECWNAALPGSEWRAVAACRDLPTTSS
jgi:hypothetical protein